MKKIIVMCLTLCISLCANAQATDLVVDCQTPGWLSSKINYGDQQTVKNLKVTGYINRTDINFIGSLTKYSLNGTIDLSEVTIIENTWNGSFHPDNYSDDQCCHLQKLVLPTNLNSYCEQYLLNEVDTLIFETQITCIENQFHRGIGHLQLGENVDSINCQLGYYNNINSIYLPKSLKYIKTEGFYNLISDLTNTNISLSKYGITKKPMMINLILC